MVVGVLVFFPLDAVPLVLQAEQAVLAGSEQHGWVVFTV